MTKLIYGIALGTIIGVLACSSPKAVEVRFRPELQYTVFEVEGMILSAPQADSLGRRFGIICPKGALLYIPIPDTLDTHPRDKS